MTKWHKVNGGLMHEDMRTIVTKQTVGNPDRNGDYFCSLSGFGIRDDVAVALARVFPATGVRTLKQAKKIVVDLHSELTQD